MEEAHTHIEQRALDRERLSLLSLWSVKCLGPLAIERLRALADGRLAPLLEVPVRDWLGAVELHPWARQTLCEVGHLEELGHRTLEGVQRGRMEICFPGEAAYPRSMVGVEDAPPLLFYLGRVSAPRRRVAMVGSRHPENGFLPWAETFAAEVAAGGVGIVSGAAEGVDRACHRGALKAGAETWAFLGSALDQLDPAQARMVEPMLCRGGMFYTELPPGVRADRTTFPRRNRLIAGAADAVLVLRAAAQSGTIHTALAALRQGKPLLAIPGEVTNPNAAGANRLLQSGGATACLSPSDVWRALRISPLRSPALPPAPGDSEALERLSPEARRIYETLSRQPRSFDELLAEVELPSGQLTALLCELELRGLALQHPGKRYERV